MQRPTTSEMEAFIHGFLKGMWNTQTVLLYVFVAVMLLPPAFALWMYAVEAVGIWPVMVVTALVVSTGVGGLATGLTALRQAQDHIRDGNNDD